MNRSCNCKQNLPLRKLSLFEARPAKSLALFCKSMAKSFAPPIVVVFSANTSLTFWNPLKKIKIKINIQLIFLLIFSQIFSNSSDRIEILEEIRPEKPDGFGIYSEAFKNSATIWFSYKRFLHPLRLICGIWLFLEQTAPEFFSNSCRNSDRISVYISSWL